MSSLVVCFAFIKGGGARAPLPREGVWPAGVFRELGGGEQDGHSGRATVQGGGGAEQRGTCKRGEIETSQVNELTLDKISFIYCCN